MSAYNNIFTWIVRPLIGLKRRIQEAHIPAPALGAPKVASGRFSVKKASAISFAKSWTVQIYLLNQLLRHNLYKKANLTDM